ncbi:MAG: 16S rRNA (cytosine(1402)-N(4))-methyltransferase RsmH [Deltaproteobacteria bacterium]|nr:16S rRNA (cytosine(1402)-N(4))-methyltransferase RsmH [Deltaproteobacteria bacterium]
MEERHHVPVLLEEALEHLDCRPGKIYVDGTVGSGGHARAILERSSPDGKLIGLDWDGQAMERARERLAAFGDRVILVKKNFKELKTVLASLAIPAVDGIVLDLGVSSEQLAEGERGFSFRSEGPLDMRMSDEVPRTAGELLRRISAAELRDIIRQYGEERFAQRIAKAIVRRRQAHPLHTTKELAEVIAGSVPFRGRIHPATRTFQALRIFVNDELNHLRTFLESGPNLLQPSGRLVIITFHSLEDRVVKEYFRKWARVPKGETSSFHLLTPKPAGPSRAEILANPRARSAKLRALARLGEIHEREKDGRSNV